MEATDDHPVKLVCASIKGPEIRKSSISKHDKAIKSALTLFKASKDPKQRLRFASEQSMLGSDL